MRPVDTPLASSETTRGPAPNFGFCKGDRPDLKGFCKGDGSDRIKEERQRRKRGQRKSEGTGQTGERLS
jgi:hypothetical protein